MDRRKKALLEFRKIYKLPKAFDGHLSQLSWIYDEILKLRELLAGDEIPPGTVQHKRTIDGIDKLEKQRLAITKELNVAAGYQRHHNSRDVKNDSSPSKKKITSSDNYEKVGDIKAREFMAAADSMPADHPLKVIQAIQNGEIKEGAESGAGSAVDGGA